MTFKQAMVKHAPTLWKDSYSFKQEVLADFKDHFTKRGEKGVQRAAEVWRNKDGKWVKSDFFPRTYA